MNLLTLLQTMAGPASDLKALLVALRARPSASDFAPVLDEWIAALDQPVDFAALEGDVKKELLDLLKGKVNPRSHPSDGI